MVVIFTMNIVGNSSAESNKPGTGNHGKKPSPRYDDR